MNYRGCDTVQNIPQQLSMKLDKLWMENTMAVESHNARDHKAQKQMLTHWFQ
jgi:hypothetical protein